FEDRPQDAILAVRSLRSLARACERESPLIFQLVGLALERLYWEGTQVLLGHGIGDAALFAELREPLAEADVSEQFRRVMGFEASMARSAELDYLRRLHDEAEVLRYFSHVADQYSRYSEAEWSGESSAPRKPVVMPEMRYAAQKFKAAEALRELAFVALDLYLESRRGGSFPADLSNYPGASNNAYTGEVLAYRVETDGSAGIGIPGAVELWKARNAPHDEYPPRFSWRLPPPPSELDPIFEDLQAEALREEW
ncbi:MAG: hypothetical protein V3T72_23555, partial [Thermoanaerobaculia bacterium]